MSCGIGCRCGSDPALLWLWCRPVAAAPIHPLSWGLPYAVGAALKSKKKKKKTERQIERKKEKDPSGLACPFWYVRLGFEVCNPEEGLGPAVLAS